MGAVSSADCDFVALLYTATLKKDMQFFDFPRYIVILQRGPLIICQGIRIPIVYDTSFNERVKAGY